MSDNLDLVLHIGAPKAGSSALQAFLQVNRSLLSKAGFYYPEHRYDRNNVSGGHAVLGKALVNKDLNTARDCFQTWLSEAKKKGLCLLLSAESFYGQPIRLNHLTENLKVVVVVYFRDPIESLISTYNQSVKRHFSTHTLKSFARKQLDRDIPEFSGMIIEKWHTEFGLNNLRVLPYIPSAFPDGKIEYSFINTLGISESARPLFSLLPRRINSSYTPSALELKRLFNHVTSSDTKLSNEIDWCLQAYSDASDEKPLPPRISLSNELFSQFADKFTPSNNYIKNNCIQSYPGGFLVYPQSAIEPLEATTRKTSSLSQVLIDAFSGEPKIIEQVQRLVLSNRESKPTSSYSLLKLAELLGDDIEQIEMPNQVFSKFQMDVLTSEVSAPADLLREIALMLYRFEQYEQAYLVISRALSLRPKGQAIIEAYRQLGEMVERNRKAL